MTVKEILSKGVKSSDLIEIRLPKTESNIIKQNKGILFCSKYEGFKGLFRKDDEETSEFGRKICDKVKEELGNQGFFTSDELPNYGISEDELASILKMTNAGEDDLIVFLIYDKAEAQKTKELLDRLLNQMAFK
jgi:glutamyl-tRNA(Gln) amidotransferase subunit E